MSHSHNTANCAVCDKQRAQLKGALGYTQEHPELENILLAVWGILGDVQEAPGGFRDEELEIRFYQSQHEIALKARQALGGIFEPSPEESLRQKNARLEAENAELRRKLNEQTNQEKGCPVTRRGHDCSFGSGHQGKHSFE